MAVSFSFFSFLFFYFFFTSCTFISLRHHRPVCSPILPLQVDSQHQPIQSRHLPTDLVPQFPPHPPFVCLTFFSLSLILFTTVPVFAKGKGKVYSHKRVEKAPPLPSPVSRSPVPEYGQRTVSRLRAKGKSGDLDCSGT